MVIYLLELMLNKKGIIIPKLHKFLVMKSYITLYLVIKLLILFSKLQNY